MTDLQTSDLPPIAAVSTDDEYWASVAATIAVLDTWVVDRLQADAVDALARFAGTHPEWPVRAGALRLLGAHFSTDEHAARVIAGATHDRVDWVAFTALQVIDAHRIRAAVPELVRISGFPSNFTQPRYARKPVGCGAAFTKRALVHIFGSVDPVELRRLEDEFFQVPTERPRAPRPAADVVLVPGGPFLAGSGDSVVGSFQMREDDNPLRTVTLPAFWIDRTTVTNARYTQFLNAIGNSPDFDHPDQEPGRSHRPAHDRDPRFNRPELPVVGVDWYDAWAFSRWAGGWLPSELEWEKAARGTDGRRYPWGDYWDPGLANHIETSFGHQVGDLAELESLLVQATTDYPAEPVLPADALPAGASPYGVLQMSGNVWELTRTNFYTREDMDPFFRGREVRDFMNRKNAFHVLRGGTWTSPPVCLSTVYRGKDLITDQHNEVGFRCVYPAEQA